MKVITYLSFTVLSIFIQFCVMDFIQERMQTNEDTFAENITSSKKEIDILFKNISSKPHALYYKRQSRSSKPSSATVTSFPEEIYSNSSLSTTTIGTTEVSTATVIFDILYVENNSTTESSTTIESVNTTDIDNTTEITFETTNKTFIPSSTNKFEKYCGCNLLYQVCDINCCCDLDCTEKDLIQFQCVNENDILYNDGCIYNLWDGEVKYGSNVLNSLFCVIKTNLPEKRNIKEPVLSLINHYKKWKSIPQGKTSYEFKKTLYKYGDPIWLLKNGTIYYVDFATPIVNNYCTDRRPIIFLKNVNIRCMVNLNDLEMFQISNTESSMVISATDRTFNSSALNCSNLYCANWTVLACNNGICRNYNKSTDVVSCTKTNCVNLALKIDYYFYYYDFKIVNASIKLHIQNFSIIFPFMLQEITINFIMTNNSLDRIIEFSGNPGYISNLPIIVSYAKSNFTDNFFNLSGTNHLTLPVNQRGICVSSNFSLNLISFGVNKRTKCRYLHPQPVLMSNNISEVCTNIQDNIKKLLRLNTEVTVSPFGNPYGIKDENWIKLHNGTEENDTVYGEYSESLLKLNCFNLIYRVSFQFVFANINEKDAMGQNKILLAKYETAVHNVSFYAQDISTVLTVDVDFLDATKKNSSIYAGSPHLNINLPKDFFFPFPPNNYCVHQSYLSVATIFCCIITFIANKITL